LERLHGKKPEMKGASSTRYCQELMVSHDGGLEGGELEFRSSGKTGSQKKKRKKRDH